MKFTTVAMLSMLGLSIASAKEEISFEMDLVTKDNIKISLNEETKCMIEYETLPFEVECNLGVSVTKDDTEILRAGATAGASVVVEGGSDLKITLEWGAKIPQFELPEGKPGLPLSNYELVMKEFPEGDEGYVEIDLPDLSSVCVTQVLGVIPDTTTDVLKTLAESTGSDICVGIVDVKKDATEGVSFRVVANIDFLNEELMKSQFLDADTFVAIRDLLNLPEVDLEVDIGMKLGEFLKEKNVSERRLRRLEDSSAAPAPYVDSNGSFTMGSMASKPADNTLLIGGVAGAGVLVLAVGGFIFFKSKQTKV